MHFATKISSKTFLNAKLKAIFSPVSTAFCNEKLEDVSRRITSKRFLALFRLHFATKKLEDVPPSFNFEAISSSFATAFRDKKDRSNHE